MKRGILLRLPLKVSTRVLALTRTKATQQGAMDSDTLQLFTEHPTTVYTNPLGGKTGAKNAAHIFIIQFKSGRGKEIELLSSPSPGNTQCSCTRGWYYVDAGLRPRCCKGLTITNKDI